MTVGISQFIAQLKTNQSHGPAGEPLSPTDFNRFLGYLATRTPGQAMQDFQLLQTTHPLLAATWRAGRGYDYYCVLVRQKRDSVARRPGLDTAGKIRALVAEPLGPYELARKPDGRSGRRVIVTGGDGVMKFYQGRTYGRPVRVPAGKEHRLYFQVEPEDIPGVVELLKRLGPARAQQGLGLDFKFVYLLTRIENLDARQDGQLHGLPEAGARVVAYFDSQEELRDFFRSMTADPQIAQYLQDLSRKRVDANGRYKPRRPGSSVFYDRQTGEELRAVCYTQGGYSEDMIDRYGPDEWRKHVRGSSTGSLRK